MENNDLSGLPVLSQAILALATSERFLQALDEQAEKEAKWIARQRWIDQNGPLAPYPKELCY